MKHKYTVEYSECFGDSIIEILKDGKPFYDDIPGPKDHFRFKVKKAIMVDKCNKIIRDFYTSDGKKPSREKYEGYTIK